MKEEEKDIKPNWLINGGVGLALLLIILGALASPLLIFVALVFLGFVSVANMVRIERLILEKKNEVKIESEESSKEEVKEPMDLPDVDEVKKSYEESSVKVEEYVRRNIEKGAKPEEIYAVLAPTYGEELVKMVLAKYIKVEKKEPEIKPVEVKEPKKKKVNKKNKKKEEKSEPKEEYKAEIVDPESVPDGKV